VASKGGGGGPPGAAERASASRAMGPVFCLYLPVFFAYVNVDLEKKNI
jgi:hypothetical protein